MVMETTGAVMKDQAIGEQQVAASFSSYTTCPAASNHQMSWSSNELINSIGAFIYKAHIDGQYFVNFADADPRIVPDPNVVYSFGQTLNNTVMKEFGAYLLTLKGNDSYLINDGTGRWTPSVLFANGCLSLDESDDTEGTATDRVVVT